MGCQLKKFFLYIYTFLFIFNPTNFVRFNLIYVLFLISLFFLLVNLKRYRYIFLNIRSSFLFLFLFYISTYLLFYFFVGGSYDSLYRVYNFILISMAFTCSAFIVVEYSKIYAVSFGGFLNFLINIGAIQLVFVFLALFSDSFRMWTLETSRLENIVSISNDYAGVRSYGLANGYTSTFPMLMGIYSLILLTVQINISKYKPNYFFFFFLLMSFLLSVILNARIGLFPVLSFLCLSAFYSFFSVKRSINILFILLLSISVSFPLLFFVDYEKYLARFMLGVLEILALFSGKTTGTLSTLSDMVHFPNSELAFYFGTGKSVFGDQENFNTSSDVGFVRDIYLFGLFNLIIFFVVISYFLTPLKREIQRYLGSPFVFTFFVSLFVYYSKGAIWASSEIYNFVLLLAIFSLYLNKRVV